MGKIWGKMEKGHRKTMVSPWEKGYSMYVTT
jgi:hypothetical protein